VTYTPALLGCGDKLAGVLSYANISRDDAIYLVTACPTNCRVTTSGGACPKGCDRRTSWPLVCTPFVYPNVVIEFCVERRCVRRMTQVFQPPRGYVNQQDYCTRALQFQAR
jgi:hypothetical protein